MRELFHFRRSDFVFSKAMRSAAPAKLPARGWRKPLCLLLAAAVHTLFFLPSWPGWPAPFSTRSLLLCSCILSVKSNTALYTRMRVIFFLEKHTRYARILPYHEQHRSKSAVNLCRARAAAERTHAQSTTRLGCRSGGALRCAESVMDERSFVHARRLPSLVHTTSRHCRLTLQTSIYLDGE